MKLLDVYLKEYIAIVNHLLNKNNEISSDKLKINKDVIYIKKDYLFDFFSKNPYEKNADKLLTWSKLHLIERDQESFTRKVYMGNNKRARMIVIKREMLSFITNLMEKNV